MIVTILGTLATGLGGFTIAKSLAGRAIRARRRAKRGVELYRYAKRAYKTVKAVRDRLDKDDKEVLKQKLDAYLERDKDDAEE